MSRGCLKGWFSTELGVCQACWCKCQLPCGVVEMGQESSAGARVPRTLNSTPRKLDFIPKSNKKLLMAFIQKSA